MKFGATILFFIFWIGLVVFLASGNNNDADMRSDGAYEPTKVAGHPLWDN